MIFFFLGWVALMGSVICTQMVLNNRFDNGKPFIIPLLSMVVGINLMHLFYAVARLAN